MWNNKLKVIGVKIMETFSLVLFGLIVYAALIVIPTVWEEHAAHH